MEYRFNYFTNIIGLFRKPYCSERLPRIISLNLQVSYLVHSFIYIVLWSSTDPAENSFCQAQFTDSTWKVNVSCSVSKVRSARNNYRCYLYKISEASTSECLCVCKYSCIINCREIEILSAGIPSVSFYNAMVSLYFTYDKNIVFVLTDFI